MSLPMEKEVCYSGEDLWALSGDYELEHGRLIPMTPPGGEHGEIVLEVATILRAHIKACNLGKVVVESGFYLSRNPDTVRAPDVSFYSAARVGARSPAGYFEIPPDLAIEVISPHDSGEETEARVRQFLAAGVAEVWVLYPRSRTLHRYRSDGQARVITVEQMVSGDEVLAGFSCRLAEFFAD